MHALIKDIRKLCNEFSDVSKYIIKYGTVVILTLLLCAGYFFIKANTSADAIENLILCNDILYSIKECMGSVYILPMLYETLSVFIRQRREP